MLFVLIFLNRFFGKMRRMYIPRRPMVWHELYSNRHMGTEQRRAARESQLPDEWTYEVVDAAFKFWDYTCAACGRADDLQKDHLIPLAHRDCPGAVPSNLIILCANCNKDKSFKDFATWHVRRFGYYPNHLIDRIHDWQWYCFSQGWN